MKGQDGGGSNNKTCEEWSLTGKSFTGASSACRGPANAPPCEAAARAKGGPGDERHLRTRSLNEEDALLFVDQVKSMCALPVYNAFLDVMKEFKAQRTSVREVIHRVSTLFKGREELIAGFNRFLPPDCRIAAAQHRPYRNAVSEASTNHTSTPTHPACFGVDGRSQHDLVERCFLPLSSGIRRKSLPFDHLNGDVNRSYCVSVDSITKTNHASSGLLVDGSRRASNRLPVKPQIPDARKPLSENNKTVSFKDVSLAEVAKYGSFSDFAFFDQARRAFKDQTVYENFLRFLALFNEEIVGGEELVRLVTPFLGRDPELLAWFKSMVSGAAGHVPRPPRPALDEQAGLGAGAARVGVSYRSLPKSYARPACSGRTPLCQQVLNDQWVSFPSWSEASTFVTAPKTLYEEFTFRCEDERFDLDVVIERNASTIRVLEYVRRKLARMAPREVAKFQLDEYLGGTSTTIHQTSLKQIYGAKAKDIIEGLKRKPAVAVPVVLRRLKAKEEEWRNAQKEFNQLWREQTETYYWKSLQCQAAIFKQKDLKSLRSKVLLNEIESLHEEWREQEKASGAVFPRPHLTLLYKNRSAFDNAAYLLSHYINSHAGFQEEEKKRMRSFVNGALPQMLFGASTAPEGAAGPACARRGAYEGDAHWYLFVRLHHSLCERLGAAQQCAARLQAADERSAQASTAPLAGLRAITSPIATFTPSS
ncbi:hypothetical protein R5R35_002710 [Gryllus longicercus]|uniref:Histone deacetylase interacting domain-containing protein n=1 Tax=Gryllus longicercus TaxID=2509291 RepID=A0AAN9VWE2_9ORTH